MGEIFTIGGPIIVAIIGLGSPLVTYLIHKNQAKKQVDTEKRVGELEKVKADAEAIDRAKKVYMDLIESMRIQHDDLRTNITRLNKELQEERDVSDGLRKRVRELEDTVDRLDDELREARIQLAKLDTYKMDKE